VFLSLNSDINSGIFFSLIFLLYFVFKKKFLSLKNFFFLFLFYFFLFLPHINIFYALIYDEPFHRTEMIRSSMTPISTIDIFKIFFFNLLGIKFFFETIFNYDFGLNLSLFILKIFFFFSIFFIREKKIFIIYFLIIIVYLVNIFLASRLFYDISNAIAFIKFFSFTYIDQYLILLFSLLSLFILNKIKNYYYVLICVVLIFQVSPSLVPFAKNYISYFKVENYRNYYTFEGYYLKNTYSQIKNIVKENRVMSIMWADPMVAVMNGIKVIDGYHNLYPLAYKKKFYKVIEKELEQDQSFKNYYLTIGSRVYAPIRNFKNPKINFLEAKKLGAKYVISKEIIYSNNLYKVAEFKDKEIIHLFKIK